VSLPRVAHCDHRVGRRGPHSGGRVLRRPLLPPPTRATTETTVADNEWRQRSGREFARRGDAQSAARVTGTAAIKGKDCFGYSF